MTMTLRDYPVALRWLARTVTGAMGGRCTTELGLDVGASEDQVEHVTDRPGHDRRYSLSSEKVRALGWAPRVRFEDGLAQTVAWYRENEWWWGPIRSGDYRNYYERQYGRALS